jgi:hypothetical protein
MTTMTAIVRNGQLELSQPIDLPDGTEVEIRLPGPAGTAVFREDEGAVTPEEIAQTLAALEKIEPFEMSDEERAALEADRQARKEWEKAHFDAHAEKLRRAWE